ncbi:hypothetical protein KK083_00545 [Fulvivirgaceae bacterium PWU4]|uniref:RHS repeat protein n=1 Tax=Chryseosolibacter histidini TaxID=2782349 RepID=A0AAP2DFB0_9BACT|nr:RHS repeat domain-containing protein [Chryseosolibacter histidini]MBT1695341.1 hypothetical protein [Chryseosolibacter histidini]
MRRLILGIGMIMAVCQSHVSLYAQGSQASDGGTFSLNTRNISALQNSVNLVSGQVAFPLTVASLTGKNGPDVTVTFQYNSAPVGQQAKLKNLFAPTGILGMGWTISQPRIVSDHKQTGTRHDDTFYLIEGEVSNPLICISHTASLSKYVLKNFSPWTIEYYPADEKWLVKHEDGSVYAYGDKNTTQNAVQWAVKWGNWVGNSTQPQNQEQMAFVWNLSSITNMYGDQVLFQYEHVDEYVANGTPSSTEKQHTKASYMKKITNATGQFVEFEYAEKTSQEFKDPHTERSEPDGYQEKFETRYLTKLNTKTKDGALIYSVECTYDFVGEDDAVKRVLTKVQKRFPGNDTQPATVFDYFVDGASKGYLKSVHNSLGAHIDYYYETITIADSDRSLGIVAPSGFGQPKIYADNDYVVITWRKLKADGSVDSGRQPVKIFAYYWDGRWMGEELWQTPAVANSDYDRCAILLSPRHFIYRIYESQFSTQQMYIARKKTLYTGAGQWATLHWPHGAGGGDPNLTGNIMSGDNYVAYSMRTLAEIRTAVWKDEQWVEHRLPISDGGSTELYVAGGLNYMLIHNDKGGAFDVIHMFYLDEERQWRQTTLPSSVSFSSDGDNNYRNFWYASNSFLVALPQYNHEYLYNWDENYSNFTKVDVLGYWQDDAYVYITNNSQMAIAESGGGGISARFDGANWLVKGPYSNYYFRHIGVGEDFFVRDRDARSNPREVYLSTFNVNTRSWNADIQYIDNRNGSLNGNNGILLKSGGNLIGMKDGWIYQRDTDGSWDYLDKIYLQGVPFAEIEWVSGYSTQITPNFIVYEYTTTQYGGASGIYIAYLENKQIVGQTKYPSHTVKSFQGNISATTVGAFLGTNAVVLKRVVDGASSGNLDTHIVRHVTWTDGNQLLETFYNYEKGKAQPGGNIAHYNKVTVVPGSNSLTVTPYGKTVHYFYNGLPEDQLLVSPSYHNPARVQLLTGAPYRIETVNATGVVVASTLEAQKVFSKAVRNSSNQLIDSSYFVRSVQSNEVADGLQTSRQSVFDAETGLLKQSIQNNSKGEGVVAESIITYLKYWWEAYDINRAKNILSPVIQSKVVRNGSAVSSSAVRWKYHAAEQRYFPEESYVWLKNGSPDFIAWNNNDIPSGDWSLNGLITRLDVTDGTVLEMRSAAQVVSSSIFDESKLNVLASASYASYDQIAYTGFDDPSEGNWQYNEALFTTASPFAGARSFASTVVSDPNFNYISRTVPAGKYEVSYWMKTASVTIEVTNGTVLSSQQIEQRNGWTLVRGVVDASAGATVTVKVPVSGLLDELRLKPLDAQMTTYVYDAVGNLLRQTDTNLRTSHYEYDGQYRQVTVRDHEGRITRTMAYHFRNQ